MQTVATMHAEAVGALNARDWERFRTLFHPEYERFPAGCGAESPDTVVRRAREMVESLDATVELWSVVANGCVSVAELVARGRSSAIEVAICMVFEVRDGKIFRQRDDLGAAL